MKLTQWAEEHVCCICVTLFPLNSEKFQFMFLKKYTSKKIVLKFIERHGTEIKCEKEVKLLGITIDVKLRFDTHVNNLCKKAAR